MSPLSRPLPRVLSTVLLLSGSALAQSAAPAKPPEPAPPVATAPPDPAPASPAPAPAPPPAAVEPRRAVGVAPDESSAACATAETRCEASAPPGDAPLDVLAWTRTMNRHARELRACLDTLDARSTPLSFSARWEPAAARPAIEVAGRADLQPPCLATIVAEMQSITGADGLALACSYTCERPSGPTSPSTAAPSTTPSDTYASTVRPDAGSAAGRSTWYGWQTLAADVASIGVMSAGLLSWTVESTVVGYGGYLLATPIVHVVNGNVGRGLGSFALRLFVPAIAGGLGGGISFLSASDDPVAVDIVTAAGAGMAIGAGICTAVDAAALAWKEKGTPTTGSLPRSAPPRIQLRPSLAIGKTSSIGLAGSF